MIKFLGNDVWHLISQSDKMTWFVLFVLLGLSIVSWSILFYKLVIWRLKKNYIKNAIANIQNARTSEDLSYLHAQYSHTIIGYYLTKNIGFLKSSASFKSAKIIMNSNEWDFLKQVSNNTLDDILIKEESLLPVLSVAAAISPLLGLLGTVWGLVHSFIDISKKQSADIITVAPGIAEALITTMAGLLVAIPTLVMYYFLKLKLLSIEQSLVLFSDKFLILINNIFLSGNIVDSNQSLNSSIDLKEFQNAQ